MAVLLTLPAVAVVVVVVVLVVVVDVSARTSQLSLLLLLLPLPLLLMNFSPAVANNKSPPLPPPLHPSPITSPVLPLFSLLPRLMGEIITSTGEWMRSNPLLWLSSVVSLFGSSERIGCGATTLLFDFLLSSFLYITSSLSSVLYIYS